MRHLRSQHRKDRKQNGACQGLRAAGKGKIFFNGVGMKILILSSHILSSSGWANNQINRDRLIGENRSLIHVWRIHGDTINS